ncbi:uncharacterized protein LAESUDRAFT_764877 [Laetiporus sulphureus 93-53]|uniref:Uncharacterized protein n=1 Tax=Laetiporus sulphureus 93-53 TaxID=1314785 RepID=A0A165B3D1_9APHY|nr:uncharacterized protein LAESUDRAFT_764877 [Laetiporus sulphureus 93-53]KZT00144.1 hypothetical protein LAESUDRAFT_764877 [Laetiporus sulphureus 93-53]
MSPKVDWPQRPSSAPPISAFTSESGDSNVSNAGTDIYDDASRPLVCAFSYPAVALSLGQTRWPELRDLYRSLSQNLSFSVRCTLTASLREMAKIVGPQHAKENLMTVWWASIGADEPEVHLKAVECSVTFVRALVEFERAEVVESLEVEYSAPLKGWREREEVIKSLPLFLGIIGIESRSPGIC